MHITNAERKNVPPKLWPGFKSGSVDTQAQKSLFVSCLLHWQDQNSPCKRNDLRTYLVSVSKMLGLNAATLREVADLLDSDPRTKEPLRDLDKRIQGMIDMIHPQ